MFIIEKKNGSNCFFFLFGFFLLEADSFIGVVEAQEPPIYKIAIVELFEKVADHLSLKDLYAIGQTCEVFQELAKTVFKKDYSVTVENGPGGIYNRWIIKERNRRLVLVDKVNLNGFCDCIQSMTINKTADMNFFRFVESKNFSLINHIHFNGIKLNDDRIACIEKLLAKAEVIRVYNCKLDGEFYEKFLRHCTSMKQLSVKIRREIRILYEGDDSEIFVGQNNNWIEQYPDAKIKIVKNFAMIELFLTKNSVQ